QVASVRSLNVIDVGVCCQDEARYGMTLPFSIVTRRSYAAERIWFEFVVPGSKGSSDVQSPEIRCMSGPPTAALVALGVTPVGGGAPHATLAAKATSKTQIQTRQVFRSGRRS